MSRNKKNKKVYTIKDVFDHYERYRLTGGQGEAWKEYQRLNDRCNDFKEQSKANEQKLQRILKDARKKIPKYPGILSDEVKLRWKNLYEFLIGASQILDLSDVWPKFDLVTSIACMMDNEEDKKDVINGDIDDRKLEENEPHFPVAPRSRNDFYSLPDDEVKNQKLTNDVTESRPIIGSYMNDRENNQRQYDPRLNLHTGSEVHSTRGVSAYREEPVRENASSIREESVRKEEPVRENASSIREESVRKEEEDKFITEDPLGGDFSTTTKSSLSQLYNKEWSEAYKLLRESGMGDIAIHEQLCDLLHKSYDHSRQMAERRAKIYADLKKCMQLSLRYPFEEGTKDAESTSSPKEIPDNSGHIDFVDSQHSELCQRLSRESDSHTIRSMCKVLKDESAFLRRNKLKFFSESLRQYVDRCVEVTWLLCTDSPARALVFCEQGTPVDKDLFSFYGSTGDTVRSCVWPAVTTQEGGQVVDKGIVAPFSNGDNKTSTVSK